MRRQGTELSILTLVIHPIFTPVPSMGQQVKLTTQERMERMGNFESSSLTRPTGCSRRYGPIHLLNGSSGPSAESIWTVCSFGRQMTWYESWSCSKSSTTRRVYTKGYPATRPRRKRVAQPLNPPALRITAGKATAMDCLNCQSLLKWQFATVTSWLSTKIGTEVSLFAGYDVSTKDGQTDYQSGDVFHLDATLAQHLPLLGGSVG